jgi:hypothetical protein
VAKLSILAGATSQSVNIFIQNSTSTTGAGLTGLVFNSAGLIAYYTFNGASATATAITLATLAAVNSAYSSGGFKEIDATHMPGLYRFDIPNAALASANGRSCVIMFSGATNQAPLLLEIELTGFDNQSTTDGGLSKLTSLTYTVANKVDSNVYTWNGTAVSAPATAGIPDINVKNYNNVAATTDANNLPKVDVEDWKAGVVPAVNVTGVPKVDVVDWLGSAPNALNSGRVDSSYSVRSGTAQAGAAGTITLDAGASATDNLYQDCVVVINSGTGVGQNRAIKSYVGSTKVATIFPNWTTNPDNTSVFTLIPLGQVDVGNWLNGTIPAVNVAGVPIVDAKYLLGTVFATPATAGIPDVNVKNIVNTAAAVDANNLLKVDVEDWKASAVTAMSSGNIPASYSVRSGTAQAGAAGTITLDAGASATDNLYQDLLVTINSGTGLGQTRSIKSYVGSTKVATIFPNWTTNPDATSVFTLTPGGQVDVGNWLNGTIPAPNVTGVPKVDVVDIIGSAPTLDVNNALNVSVKYFGGTAVTARDIGASVLLSAGTGAGQLDFTSGVVKANTVQILGGACPAVNVTGVPKVDVVDWLGTAPNVLNSGRVDALGSIRSNTAAAGAAGTITLDAGASATNNLYQNCVVVINSGTGAGQARQIKSYVGSTQVATIFPNWATNPDNTSVFTIIPLSQVDVGLWLNGTIPAVNVTGVPLVDLKYTLGTISPAAAGSVGIDWAQVANKTSTVDLSNTTIKNVDNAVTGSLTAAQIATGVWQDTTAGDFTVASSIGKSLFTSGVVPGGSGGLFIAGTNAATTANITGNITGNVSGSVGSVTAAVTLSAGDSPIIQTGTAAAGAATTITLASALGADNLPNGCTVKITSGTGSKQSRVITGYVDATKVATVDRAWTTNPDNTSVYAVLYEDSPKTDSNLAVTAGTVSDKTGYTLTQAFPANFSSLGISGGGHISNVDTVLSPTSAQIATAVWQDTTAGDFTVATSPGKIIFTQLGGTFTTTSSSVFTAGSLVNAPTGGSAPTVAQISTAVWQDLLAGGDFGTAGSIGKLINDDLDAKISTRFPTSSAPANFSSLGISGGGHISNVDTLTTYTGDTPQTGDCFVHLPPRIKKNVLYNNFSINMVSSTDGKTPVTGATVTAKRSIDGGALAACANAVSEIGSGLYAINLAASDLNGDSVVFSFSAVGALNQNIFVAPQP